MPDFVKVGGKENRAIVDSGPRPLLGCLQPVPRDPKDNCVAAIRMTGPFFCHPAWPPYRCLFGSARIGYKPSRVILKLACDKHFN